MVKNFNHSICTRLMPRLSKSILRSDCKRKPVTRSIVYVDIFFSSMFYVAFKQDIANIKNNKKLYKFL